MFNSYDSTFPKNQTRNNYDASLKELTIDEEFDTVEMLPMTPRTFPEAATRL